MNKNEIVKKLNEKGMNFTLTDEQIELISILTNENFTERIDSEYEKYMDFIRSTLGYNPNIKFSKILDLLYDEDSQEIRAIFSQQASAIETVAKYLNLRHFFSKNPRELTVNKIYQRIETLLDVTTPQELQKKFPFIAENLFRQLRREKEMSDLYQQSLELDGEEYQKFIESLEAKGIDIEEVEEEQAEPFNFEDFLTKSAYDLKEIMKHRQEISDYALTHPFNLNDIPGLSREQIDLYYFYKFLRATTNQQTLEECEDYLYYASTFNLENKMLPFPDILSEKSKEAKKNVKTGKINPLDSKPNTTSDSTEEDNK